MAGYLAPIEQAGYATFHRNISTLHHATPWHGLYRTKNRLIHPSNQQRSPQPHHRHNRYRWQWYSPPSRTGRPLLLDHGSISKHGMPPFGTHPHRGHSVITVLLHGKMQSWDSLTDETTTIEGPSSYWVDAASGVYHNESSIITDENDISQHVSAFQLWISVKEVERQCSPSLQYDGNLPLGEIKSSTDGGGEVVGTIRYFVGGDNTVIKTIRPVLVGLVTQRPGTTARIPIESKHGGFVVHIAGAARYGDREEVTTKKNNALVFADAGESDDSSSEDFLQVTTTCASSTLLDEVTLCQYLVCAGEKVEETWCKKLVANGAVIAKDEVEARAIAAQIELDKTFVPR